MKSNRFIQDKKGQLDINLALVAVLGLVLISSFLVIGTVILQGLVDGAGIDASTQGAVVYTQSGVSVDNGNVTIGTEVYTLSNSTFGEFYIDNGYNTTATFFVDAFVTEINANSTLITAVDNGDDTATVTSILSGTVGNYASTENMSNGAFASATMTGGVNSDSFYATITSLTGNIESAMGLAGTLLLVIIGVAILMLLAGVMVIMQLFTRR